MFSQSRQALKRLKTDNNIVILPADKGRVTVVMNKTDYFDKMDALGRLRISLYGPPIIMRPNDESSLEQ